MKLRPQVTPWTREVPSGGGITGLWRSANQVYTLKQDGKGLTGTVGEGGQENAIAAIQDGKVDDGKISFVAANVTYTGTVKADSIELQRSGGGGPGGRRNAEQVAATGPKIGPPPDGSDPSRPAFVGLGGGPPAASAPLVLRRTKR